MTSLRNTLYQLLTNHVSDQSTLEERWLEIERKHSTKKRFYHDLSHLENMLFQLEKVRSEIENWEAVIFALFYHDIVYSATKATNEEKSAALAKKRMLELNIPEETILRCSTHILATKKHAYSSDSDTNYFLDTDLSILGLDWETYQQYAKNVRKEYAIYPDMIYIPGRKKVLAHFLVMDSIFKTPFFQSEFELNAKNNLEAELSLLGS